jgi:diaminohydroxyphosphoribosylaminopyrimidine deaminase/5-amino-6-(5-phosphoribosylamino)uracil reductase
LTTIVTSRQAPAKRVTQLSERVRVVMAPCQGGRIELPWLLTQLGNESVTDLLVEGGGEVNASFLFGGFAHRVAFFYAPRIIGGQAAPGAVGGSGAARLAEALSLSQTVWRRIGVDLLLTARVAAPQSGGNIV